MHLRRRHWLTLLACLAAAGASSSQVLSPQDAAPEPAAPPAPTAPAETPASGLGLGWGGAPIVTSGSVSYDLRTVRGQDVPSNLSQLVTTNLNARSYIYQPWFATVQGTLGLTTGSTRNSGGADAAAQGPFASTQEQFASRDSFVTGNGRVDLFPRSRFPFEFHVERSDSRIDTTLASTMDFRRQSFGFSQRYQPITREYRLSASFDRHEQVSAGYRDAQNLLVEAESFDAAILNLILSVIPDGRACLQSALCALKPAGRLVIFDKFLSDRRKLSPTRKFFNLFSTFLGTDINRRLSDLMLGCACTITYDEPSIGGGMYRVIMLKKKE